MDRKRHWDVSVDEPAYLSIKDHQACLAMDDVSDLFIDVWLWMMYQIKRCSAAGWAKMHVDQLMLGAYSIFDVFLWTGLCTVLVLAAAPGRQRSLTLAFLTEVRFPGHFSIGTSGVCCWPLWCWCVHIIHIISLVYTYSLLLFCCCCCWCYCFCWQRWWWCWCWPCCPWSILSGRLRWNLFCWAKPNDLVAGFGDMLIVPEIASKQLLYHQIS